MHCKRWMQGRFVSCTPAEDFSFQRTYSLGEETAINFHISFVYLYRLRRGLYLDATYLLSSLTSIAHITMSGSESSIDPPELLPKEGSLLTNEVCQRHRQILLARLEKQETCWMEQLEEHEGAETPDPDQLDLDRAMAMSYRTLTPYVASDLRSLTFRDHDNQNYAMDTVEKCRTFSKFPQTAYEDLERYRSLARLFRFASEAADEGKPITYTQKNHVTCESYWQWYEQVSQSPTISTAH